MTTNPDFPRIQQRLKALGHYDAAIDDVWGPSMSAGIDEVLTLMERARGIEPPRLDTGGADLLGEEYPELPNRYSWLRQAGYLPKHLRVALNLIGVKEQPGSGDNPQIMAWAKRCRDAGLNVAGYSHDSVPWCGLFMAFVMLEAEREPVHDPLWALNWSKFGVDGGQPELGDVLTFQRTGGGHVALYIAEDTTTYHILGANQSDQVNIMRIAKTRMHSCRQVPYKTKPASVRTYFVDAAGAISSNEQ